MSSPVERLEAWCEEILYGAHVAPTPLAPRYVDVQTAQAYRAIIAMHQNLSKLYDKYGISQHGDKAVGVYKTIDLLADAVNPEEK